MNMAKPDSTASGATSALSEIKLSSIVGRVGEGVQIDGTLLRLTRHLVVFEIYSPDFTLRVSAVLDDCKIVISDRMLYAGRAVVRSLVNAGLKLICEATLNEESWTGVEFTPGVTDRVKLGNEFKKFIHEWQKFYLVSAEYKVAVADLQTFLSDLRLLLEQMELKIASSPVSDRVVMERDIVLGLGESVIPAIDHLFDQFEEASDKIEEELRPAHRAFGRRQLHPLLLCAPFMRRTYTKPLGYAGDYEMMNMIVSHELEGNSLFAKLANAYLLDQVAPRAVRNRVGFLYDKMVDEASRVARCGRTANIYSIACGPAREAQNFVAEQPLSDQAHFLLLDFNEETLQYVGNRMEELKKEHHRRTSIKLVKNSVHKLLKGPSKRAPEEPGYDLIYCSGLYDYLSDAVIKKLNTYFYDQLLPSGLLVVGNFAPCTPRQNLMEHLSEWFLIYRDAQKLATLAPEQASKENCVVRAEPTGANIFLEIRKPK